MMPFKETMAGALNRRQISQGGAAFLMAGGGWNGRDRASPPYDGR